MPAPLLIMSDLSSKKCTPCEGNIPPFDKSEIHNYLKKVDGWDVKSNEDKSYYLIKDFKINDGYSVSLANFTNFGACLIVRKLIISI